MSIFLAGAPNYGIGAIPTPTPPAEGETTKAEYLSPKTAFYRDQVS